MSYGKEFDIAFKITGYFETSGDIWGEVTGNFDGQGLSFGPNQQCYGQGSLQILLNRVIISNPQDVMTAFGPLYESLKQSIGLRTLQQQLQYAITTFNDSNNRLKPEWNLAFKKLGQCSSMQNVFIDEAKKIADNAYILANWIKQSDKPTIREFCFAYDTTTQNGGIGSTVKTCLSLIRPLVAPFKKKQNDWLRLVAWARSAWSYIEGNAPFAIDTLERKLLIIEGHGKRGGSYLDLEKQFGLSDEVY